MNNAKIAAAVAKQEQDILETMELLVNARMQPGGREFLLKVLGTIDQRFRDNFHAAVSQLGTSPKFTQEFESDHILEALIARLAQVGWNAVSVQLGEMYLRNQLESEVDE